MVVEIPFSYETQGLVSSELHSLYLTGEISESPLVLKIGDIQVSNGVMHEIHTFDDAVILTTYVLSPNMQKSRL